MIRKFTCLEKMLRQILIFSLLFVAIHGDGKFAVLQAPESINFHGEQPILGDDVGEVILAATGNTVNGNAQWTGLSIADPFNLPTKAVVALFEGASIDVKSAKFEVPLTGAGVDDSLDTLVAEMKESGTSVCDIDFSSKHSAKTLYKCFGISAQTNEAALPATTALDAEDTKVKPFLRAIADINDAMDEHLKLKKNKAAELKSVVVVRISIVPIVQAYGEGSAQQTEAVELIKNTIAKLLKVAGDALFIALSDASNGKSRSKREVVAADPKNPYNLAEYYDNDYPVIFNIILWFMIVFGLALLAISYAIGSMDPGRDSIIYRMTSTRMKKDN